MPFAAHERGAIVIDTHLFLDCLLLLSHPLAEVGNCLACALGIVRHVKARAAVKQTLTDDDIYMIISLLQSVYPLLLANLSIDEAFLSG